MILLENETRARPKIFMKKLKSKKIALSITRIIPVYKNILALSLLISVILVLVSNLRQLFVETRIN